MRLLSLLYLFGVKQSYRESDFFFWKVYCNAKKTGKKGDFYGCVLHNLFQNSCANIALEAEFADKPSFPHGITGIFVSRGAKIGKNCVIFQQVTIGSNTIEGSKGFGAPTIGDDVYIGVGAKIIGGVHIGNRCRIGAGCIVTCDVPDDSTVVMGKPRILVNKNRDNTYREYK